MLEAFDRTRPCWLGPSAYAALVFTLVVAACGGGTDTPEPEPEPDPYVSTESPMEALTEADYGDLDPAEIGLNTNWTRNRVSNSATPAEAVRLVGVSTESMDGFDRVVFSFEGDVPGYRLALGTEGGGGCDGTEAGPDTPAHLAVEFMGATAAGGEAPATGLPALASAEQTCDADGTIRWLLGLAADTHFRMMQMRGEPRLVVDLRHPEG